MFNWAGNCNEQAGLFKIRKYLRLKKMVCIEESLLASIRAVEFLLSLCAGVGLGYYLKSRENIRK